METDKYKLIALWMQFSGANQDLVMALYKLADRGNEGIQDLMQLWMESSSDVDRNDIMCDLVDLSNNGD